jgi:flagellar basal-body rod protein FlgB
MSQAVARQTVAASNLANLDTPGYHAREVTFDQALQDQLNSGATLSATDGAHFGAQAPNNTARVQEAMDLPERRDGNNVQLDRELLGLTTATTDFNEAQAVLSAKFRLVRYAINEGR